MRTQPSLSTRGLVAVCGLICAVGAVRPLKADINFGNDPSSMAAIGTFFFDNDEQSFTFSLDQQSILDVQTTSYASSQNGFAPNLTPFNTGTGAFIAQDDGGTAPGGCGTRGIGADRFCFDAAIDQSLAAGNYTLVLTEQGNQALGGLADGFFFHAVYNPCPTNNFTNSDCQGYGPSPGAFYLFDGTEQTGDWALSGGTVATAATVTPEPPFFLPSLGLTAILTALFIARRLRRA